MWNKIVKKVLSDLQVFISNEISVNRALDLLEASTSNVKEIVAINTIRETLLD